MINELPIDAIGHATTPAANHLFEVNENDPKHLSEDEAMNFHHVVARLLFLCKLARTDIHTAVAFLCTRVKKPDEDDYKTLCRVIKYLQSTMEVKLTLEADDPTSMVGGCIIRITCGYEESQGWNTDAWKWGGIYKYKNRR